MRYCWQATLKAQPAVVRGGSEFTRRDQPMALNVGSRLGHYDVTALIGEAAWGKSIRRLIPSSRVRLP